MNFGNDLLPACLDTGKEEIGTAEASGWGRLGNRQALANTLQVVSIRDSLTLPLKLILMLWKRCVTTQLYAA